VLWPIFNPRLLDQPAHRTVADAPSDGCGTEPRLDSRALGGQVTSPWAAKVRYKFPSRGARAHGTRASGGLGEFHLRKSAKGHGQLHYCEAVPIADSVRLASSNPINTRFFETVNFTFPLRVALFTTITVPSKYSKSGAVYQSFSSFMKSISIQERPRELRRE